MFTKRLLHVSVAILCLTAAYHLGASTANAQKSTPPEVAAGWYRIDGYTTSNSGGYVVMTNGEVYLPTAKRDPYVRLAAGRQRPHAVARHC